MKLLKWGMACCMLVSVVAWQTKDTSFQPIDTNGFIAEMQKQFAEVQAIRKKDNHREELDRKMRDTHRMLMHTYPVYYDWWLQDGQDAKNEKDGKDVNWFRGTLSRQLSMRLQKLNVTTTVNDTPESITAAFQAYLKACEVQSVWLHSLPTVRKLYSQSSEHCVLPSSLIPKELRMPVPNVITLQAVHCRRLR